MMLVMYEFCYTPALVRSRATSGNSDQFWAWRFEGNGMMKESAMHHQKQVCAQP
jgi:hypothetical protein